MKRAFLGMGLLGVNFVIAMRNRGLDVTVWNRTASKTQKPAEYGAVVARDLSDAVRDMDLIHMALRDDDSVDDLLLSAEPYLKHETIIIDHTTTSVDGARKRTKVWGEKGFFYQHAPVMMNPQSALEGKGTMIVSGDQKLIHKLDAELAPMTGEIINCGEEPGKAAAYKLVGNLLFMAIHVGLSDVLSFCKSTGIMRDEITRFFSPKSIEGWISRGFEKLFAGEFSQPSWELPMARKDVALMMNEVEKAGNTMVCIPALAKEMDKWIKSGHSKDDWTVFASENVKF